MDELTIVSRSTPLPFQLDEENVDETLRLALPLARPSPREAAAEPAAARADGRDHPPAHGGRGLPRHPDADPLQVDARGRPRLRRPEPPPQGEVLRAPAEPADPQAADDDRGLRPLLPDRDLLPGRGPACRPRAGDHAARRRDELPGPRGAVPPDGGDVRRDLARVPRRRDRHAVAADDLCRGRPPLRLRQARHALRARARGRDRGHARVGVRRLRRGGGGPLPPRAAHLLSRRARRSRGARQGTRREGPRVRRPRGERRASLADRQVPLGGRARRARTGGRARRSSSLPTRGRRPRASSATCDSTPDESSA